MQELPQIQRCLQSYVRRRRLLAAFESMLLAIAVFVTFMLVILFLDRWLALGRPARSVALLLDIAAGLALIARPVWLLLRPRFDAVAVAREIEHHNPVFDQRLITVVSTKGDPGAMAAHLHQQIEILASQQKIRPPLRLTRLLWPGLVIILAAAFFVSCWHLVTLDLPQLFSRFFQPLEKFAPVTATQLDVLTGNVSVIDGRPLAITAKVQPSGQEDVTLHLSDDGRTWTLLPMSRQNTGAYAVVLTAVDREASYFVTAGDATSLTYNIRLLRVPAVSEFRFRCHPPAYLHASPYSLINTDGQIDAPVGTDITIDIAAIEPLRRLTLSSGNNHLETDATSDPAVRQAHFTVARDARFDLRLFAQSGMTGSGPPLIIRAIPTHPPMARILDPADGSQLPPAQEIVVNYSAADDHGLAALHVEAHLLGGATQSIAIPLRNEPREKAGAVKVAFGRRHLVVGDVVAVRLHAQNTAGQTTSSEVHEVLICPRPVNVDSPELLDEFSRASAQADRLAALVDDAGAALDRSEDLRADHLLADASDLAPVFQQALLKLAAQMSRTPEEQNAFEKITTSATNCRTMLAELSKTPLDVSEAKAKLANTADDRHQLAGTLRTVKNARFAAAAMADRMGLAEFQKQQAGNQRRSIKEVEEKATDQINREIRDIGLDPAAADLDDQLLSRINAAENN